MPTPLRRAALVLVLAAAAGSAAGCSSGNAKPAASATPVASAAAEAGSALTAVTGTPSASAVPTVSPSGTPEPAATTDAPATPDAATTTDAASNTPQDVRRAYAQAYETKSFATVIASSCAIYKTQYGTDTSDLEQRLRPYTITAKDLGDPEVTDSVARARLQLSLTFATRETQPTIRITMVREDGQWRFCGETVVD